MTKNADPQMFFSEMKKIFQNSFGLWARQNTNESKENLHKDLRVPILFTSTDLQRYLGQRKVSTFQCQKNEVFFPLRRNSFSFCFQKLMYGKIGV